MKVPVGRGELVKIYNSHRIFISSRKYLDNSIRDAHFLNCFIDAKTPTKGKKWTA